MGDGHNWTYSRTSVDSKTAAKLDELEKTGMADKDSLQSSQKCRDGCYTLGKTYTIKGDTVQAGDQYLPTIKINTNGSEIEFTPGGSELALMKDDAGKNHRYEKSSGGWNEVHEYYKGEETEYEHL